LTARNSAPGRADSVKYLYAVPSMFSNARRSRMYELETKTWPTPAASCSRLVALA
jgi:hypothetical protein